MFSGIIEEKGQVKRILRDSQGCKLIVESRLISKDARLGDSVSVNGVCLTVVGVNGKDVSFDVMQETLRGTNLSGLSGRNVVNLERSLKVGDRLSGHFVTGHIDCLGRVRSIKKEAHDYAMDIEFPIDKKTYVAEKGSIAIDGVSLTIGEVKGRSLKVYLIPLTLKLANLGLKKVGDSVNIEFDILSKYALDAQVTRKNKSKITAGFLMEHGFSQ